MNQFSLLKTRKFLPLFVCQFLGAFNDNVFKNALIIIITYSQTVELGIDPQLAVTISAGIFILPFFIFSSIAGEIADKYEKSKLLRMIKLAEIILMTLVAIGLYLNKVYFLITMLFLIGAQAAFFGPLKYSILPAHLKEKELISGNALIEAGTFIAILFGTIIGGLLILKTAGAAFISALLVLVSLCGWISSLFIPYAKPEAPNLHIKYNIFIQTFSLIIYTKKHKDVFLSIIGISWFWLIGALYLSQFPNFAKNTLNSNEQIVTLFLIIFSSGIAIGSLLCNKLLKGKVNATFAPLGAIGMAFFTLLLFVSTKFIPYNHALITSIEDFFTMSYAHIAITFNLFMISIFGGIYIVPLYAILQTRSEDGHRARIIACNNIMNSLFMVIASIVTILLFLINLDITEIFLVISLVNFPVAYLIKKIIIKHRKRML